jgi:hypothetical protein
MKTTTDIEINGHEMDIDTIIHELDHLGYIVLKVQTIQQKEKVSVLIDEMYPYYNDQPQFITLNF